MIDYNLIANTYFRGERLLALFEEQLSRTIYGPADAPPASPAFFNMDEPPLGLDRPRPVLELSPQLNAEEASVRLADILTAPQRETSVTGLCLNLSRQWAYLVQLKRYYLEYGHLTRLNQFRETMIKTWKINLKSFDEIYAEIDMVHRWQRGIAAEFLPYLEQIHNGQISLAGSVGQGTSLRSSDYDFATISNIGSMRSLEKKAIDVFGGKEFVNNCWGTKKADANVPLLHLSLKDNDNRRYELDFCCRSHTSSLAREVTELPFKERCYIIAAKMFLKQMKLIDSRGRLTSSSLVVAYLCYRNDPNVLERSFSRFMAYFSNFNFFTHRMTTDGPQLKEQQSLSYEAYDLFSKNASDRNYNTLGRTEPDAMNLAKEWTHFLSFIPGVGRILLSLF